MAGWYYGLLVTAAPAVESAAVETPVTTAGPARSFGTQYRHMTVSRELREKERKARKAARKLRERVTAEIKTQDWYADPEAATAATDFLKTEIAETYEPQFLDAGERERSITDAMIRHLMHRAYLRAIMAAIEDDEDLLLLAA